MTKWQKYLLLISPHNPSPSCLSATIMILQSCHASLVVVLIDRQYAARCSAWPTNCTTISSVYEVWSRGIEVLYNIFRSPAIPHHSWLPAVAKMRSPVLHKIPFVDEPTMAVVQAQNFDQFCLVIEASLKTDFYSSVKFYWGISEKFVLLLRFSLTLSVWFGRDNSIRWGAASGPTDAAIRLQNSGDEIKQRYCTRNTINCPTRCRVYNTINTLPEISTQPLPVTGITNSHLQMRLRRVALGNETMK